MAINELIAKGSTKAPGESARGIAEVANRVMDYRTKVAELEDFQQEAPTRRAERGLRKKKAEQETEILTEYGDKIKESTALQIENQISNLKRDNRWNELMQIDSTFQGIKGPEDWERVRDNVAPAVLKQYDINPQGTWEENKKAVKYLVDRVQHDLKQRQAMEMASLQGRYAAQAASNRAGYTPDPTSTLPTGDYFGQIMLSMERDPAFQQLLGPFGSPGGSKEYQQAASIAAGEFEGLVKQNADLNRQRAKRGLDPIRLSKSDALETAKFRTKAYLFAGEEDSWFGGPQLSYMSPEQAQEAEYEWRSMMLPQILRDEEFQQLTTEQQELVLHKMYMKEKMIELQTAQQRLSGRINSR